MQYASSQLDYRIGDDIRKVVRTLLSNLHVVALVTVATVCLVIAYIWFATILYSSKVEILIDPRQRQTVESEVTPTGLGTSAAGADTLLLESQVEILRSQNILDTLIKSENLTEDPEYASTGGGGPLGAVKTMIKTVVYGPQADLWRSASAYDQAVKTIRKRLDVARERNTYVIGITMQSSDADKAARLANRIAEIYVADVNDASSSSTRESATVLTTKLDEMRDALNEAAAAVESYRQDNNLIDANETLVVEQQLGDLNRALSQARLDVQAAQARRNQLRAAVSSGIGSEIRLPDLAESAVVSDLQMRLAEVDSTAAELEMIYADRHPALRRSRERKASLEAALRNEFQRVIDRLDVSYETALENANALEARLAELETQMGTSNADSVQLRELEREAESIQTVYEGFLRRSKEAWEQVDIPSSTARVISWAYPASRPSDPPVFLLLVSGLGFGVVLGVIAAFLYGGLFKARGSAPVKRGRVRHA